jgi:hypothetical protein
MQSPLDTFLNPLFALLDERDRTHRELQDLLHEREAIIQSMIADCRAVQKKRAASLIEDILAKTTALNPIKKSEYIEHLSRVATGQEIRLQLQRERIFRDLDDEQRMAVEATSDSKATLHVSLIVFRCITSS